MNLGIIGTNFVSDMFMEATTYIEDIKVIAVCSGKYENALIFKNKYHLLYAYESYQSMFKDNKIDAVYIATPNYTHFDIAKSALESGVHVFCEKPFMVNDEEVKKIYALAHKNELYIHDGIIPLYTDNFKILKDNLHKVGKIRRAVLNFGKYSSRYNAYLNNENPTTFRKEFANGSMMDIGVYVLSIAIALFGKPKDIFANTYKLETGVDGLGSMILQYDDFEVILLHSKITNTLITSEIQGEKGIIQIEKPSLMEDIYFIDKKSKIKISKDESNSYSYQLKDFVNNVNNNISESALVTHELSLTIIKVLTLARRKCNIIYPND